MTQKDKRIDQILQEYQGQTFSEPLEAERWLINAGISAAQEKIKDLEILVDTILTTKNAEIEKLKQAKEVKEGE